MRTMEVREKDDLQQLRERLALTARLVWDRVDQDELAAIFAYADHYKTFLDRAKTEREAVQEIVRQAQARGFEDLSSRTPGPRVFYNYKGKNIALVVQGKRPLSSGLRLVASHIDSPRLDLKPYPLYEDTDLTFLKTQYYGGIKKYQWLARPLAIHGVILKADGATVDLQIGEDPADPVFTVLDLLPHLARKAQMEKKVTEAFEGEKLNVLVGTLPLGDTETKERFKLHFLKLLEERYGINEEDFTSAEVEVVPAGPARDLGWDRSLVGGYGQDDRACAYAELAAALDLQEPEHTCVALFYDKEETGSDGNNSTSDANAEYVAWLRRVFQEHGVIWQAGQLGKVDEGGGGTIAKFLAIHGLEIIDCGTPLLSMHSPFEVASKADLYMTFKAYRAFFGAG